MRITQGMIGVAATACGVFRGMTSREPRSWRGGDHEAL